MILFELLFETIRSKVKSKNDVIVSVVHLNCLHKGFLCVGIGENFPEVADSETGSELLPNGWNDSQETYVLRYVHQNNGQKLLIKCVKVTDILIVSSLLVTGDNSGSTLVVKTDEHMTDKLDSIKSAFIGGSVDNLSKLIQKEIFDKPKETSAKTRERSSPLREDSRDRRTSDPLRIGPNPGLGPLSTGYGYDPIYGGQWPPPIGGADLDPLGIGQGGMIMDPRGFPTPFGRPRNPAPGLPRGAIPPGARFDPFGPLGIGPDGRPIRNPGNIDPDPDHLPPPGYDDMFM